MEFEEEQLEILRKRQSILDSLGLAETESKFAATASKAKAALKRRRDEDRQVKAAFSEPVRRSERVRNIGTGVKTEMPEGIQEDVDRLIAMGGARKSSREQEDDMGRPTGDLPWWQTVSTVDLPAHSASTFNTLRKATAELLGLPAEAVSTVYAPTQEGFSAEVYAASMEEARAMAAAGAAGAGSGSSSSSSSSSAAAGGAGKQTEDQSEKETEGTEAEAGKGVKGRGKKAASAAASPARSRAKKASAAEAEEKEAAVGGAAGGTDEKDDGAAAAGGDSAAAGASADPVIEGDGDASASSSSSSSSGPKLEPLDMKGNVFVFTGFRDGKLEAAIRRAGGKVAPSMNLSVTCVVAADAKQQTNKVAKAAERGVRVVTRDELVLLAGEQMGKALSDEAKGMKEKLGEGAAAAGGAGGAAGLDLAPAFSAQKMQQLYARNHLSDKLPTGAPKAPEDKQLVQGCSPVPGMGEVREISNVAMGWEELWGERKKVGKGSSRGSSPARPSFSASSSSGSSPSSRLQGLSIPSEDYVMKVVEERITSAAFHPSSSRTICLCGTKDGRLGVWVPEAGQSGASGSGIDSRVAEKEEEKARKEADDAEKEEDESSAAEREAGTAAAGTKKTRDLTGGAVAAGGAGGAAAAEGGDEEEDEEEEEEEEKSTKLDSTVSNFRPHSGTIDVIKVPLTAPHLVITASRDGYIRALDLNKGASWCLFDETEIGRGLSIIDIASSHSDAHCLPGGAFTLYAASRDGLLYSIDTRTSSKHRGAWGAPAISAHPSAKISALSVLPQQQAVMTAGGDGAVRLWDLRKLPSPAGALGWPGGSHNSTQTKATRTNTAGCLIAEASCGKSISNASFSLRGAFLSSMDFADRINIWSMPWERASLEGSRAKGGAGAGGGGKVQWTVDAVEAALKKPLHSIVHNNQTGRWLTPMKLCFDPAEEEVLVTGDMGKAVQVWHAPSGKRLAHYISPYMTASPPVNAVHPCPERNMIVSTTASGRMYLWV